MVEPELQAEFQFTEEELANFIALVATRDFEIDPEFARHLLSSLSQTQAKVVVSLRERDIVVTAEEAQRAIGRNLEDGGDS